MQKLFFFLIALAPTVASQSQILISLQLPPNGMTVKSQLWNFSLVNTSNTTVNVQVEVTLTDASNNQRVLTGTSRTFSLSKGIKQVQPADVLPTVYNVNNSNYGIDATAEGFLPVGVFNICYTVNQLVSDASDRVAEDCETMEIEPLSPPQLIVPADSDHVDIGRPMFTWIPPLPFNLFNNLQYDLVVAEVQNTQTGATAIQQNVPVLTASGLSATNYPYPMSSPELDTGKLYAWQITARNNTSAIAKSEVNTFRYVKYPLDTAHSLKSGFFVPLKKENEAAYAVCESVLRYEYLNELNDTAATIRIVDINAAREIEVFPERNAVSLHFGQNFISMKLDDVSSMADKHLYLFELTNSKLQKWYVKFEYRRPQQ